MIKYFNNKRHTQTKVMSYDQCIFLDLSNINSNINLFLIKDKFLNSLLGGNMVCTCFDSLTSQTRKVKYLECKTLHTFKFVTSSMLFVTSPEILTIEESMLLIAPVLLFIAASLLATSTYF